MRGTKRANPLNIEKFTERFLLEHQMAHFLQPILITGSIVVFAVRIGEFVLGGLLFTKNSANFFVKTVAFTVKPVIYFTTGSAMKCFHICVPPHLFHSTPDPSGRKYTQNLSPPLRATGSLLLRSCQRADLRDLAVRSNPAILQKKNRTGQKYVCKRFLFPVFPGTDTNTLCRL